MSGVSSWCVTEGVGEERCNLKIWEVLVLLWWKPAMEIIVVKVLCLTEGHEV